MEFYIFYLNGTRIKENENFQNGSMIPGNFLEEFTPDSQNPGKDPKAKILLWLSLGHFCHSVCGRNRNCIFFIIPETTLYQKIFLRIKLGYQNTIIFLVHLGQAPRNLRMEDIQILQENRNFVPNEGKTVEQKKYIENGNE